MQITIIRQSDLSKDLQERSLTAIWMNSVMDDTANPEDKIALHRSDIVILINANAFRVIKNREGDITKELDLYKIGNYLKEICTLTPIVYSTMRPTERRR